MHERFAKAAGLDSLAPGSMFSAIGTSRHHRLKPINISMSAPTYEETIGSKTEVTNTASACVPATVDQN